MQDNEPTNVICPDSPVEVSTVRATGMTPADVLATEKRPSILQPSGAKMWRLPQCLRCRLHSRIIKRLRHVVRPNPPVEDSSSVDTRGKTPAVALVVKMLSLSRQRCNGYSFLIPAVSYARCRWHAKKDLQKNRLWQTPRHLTRIASGLRPQSMDKTIPQSQTKYDKGAQAFIPACPHSLRLP